MIYVFKIFSITSKYGTVNVKCYVHKNTFKLFEIYVLRELL